MATANGTATDYLDLLDRFDTFVTATLPSGQRWTQLKDSVEGANLRNLYYVAPGLAGADLIYSNLFAFQDVGDDYYNIGMRGMRGFNTGAPFDNQPNQSAAGYLLLWNTSIPYWFVGSGRRAIIVAKVSGVWQFAHIGLIVPGASPSEWQYPMHVGGMHSIATKRWSNTDFQHKAFWNPTADPSPILNPGSSSGSYLCTPGGEWMAVGNYSNSSEFGTNSEGNLVWPYGTQFEQVGKCYGASSDYGLQPLVLHSSLQGRAVWGEFDGVFFVSGFANATENILTIGGVNHLVVQNAFRSSGPDPATTNSNQYATIALA
jgi:hypothetical protein